MVCGMEEGACRGSTGGEDGLHEEGRAGAMCRVEHLGALGMGGQGGLSAAVGRRGLGWGAW
jgi:hypothetical protein